MKSSHSTLYLTMALIVSLMAGCAPTSPTQASIPTSIPVSATPESAIPEPTPTLAPTMAALPGIGVVPLDQLGKSIPWLPMENTARPGVAVFLFNLSKPPFTNVLVRKAFAAAIDREAIARIARDNGAIEPRAATTFTPPETLGRNLFNEVGVRFHPSDAREYLVEAGYTNLANFPPITLMTNRGPDDINVKIGEELIRMWQIYLGVNVNLEIVEKKYFDRVATDPTEIFWNAWAADYNDPDNFLLENFRTGSQYNHNNFSNNAFDDLVKQAGSSDDPAMRQELYTEAERILCETEVALIPLYHTTYNIP